MACNPLTSYARECGKNNTSGLRDDVYLISFDALVPITGSTEVYSTAVTGLVSAIGVPTTGSTKFVKYSGVKNQVAIKETYALTDTGSYDIQKELTFTLGNLGSVSQKLALENLVSNPVAALTKMRNGTWIAFGLNGQFSLSGSEGNVADKTNNRVLTFSGSDTEFLQVVDPTIVASLLSAV